MVTRTRDAAPGLNHIVGLMSSEFRAEVVQRALEWRNKASGEPRKSFQSVLRKKVKIDGFRNSNKADNQQLFPEVFHLLPSSAELVGSVLHIWMESHTELYKEVRGHLSELKVPTHGLDFSENRFAGSWNFDIWQQEKEKFVASHSQFNKDDVALMLCCVSGNMPDSEQSDNEVPAVTKADAFFSQWLEEMQELPADAPQWRQANDFVASATEIIQYKSKVRRHTQQFNEILAEMKQEFGRELAFFQCESNSWSVERFISGETGSLTAEPEQMADLIRRTESLKSLLTDYRSVHDIAPTIEEEVALWPRRAELQGQILGCLNQIYQLFSKSDEKDEDLAAIRKLEALGFTESSVPLCEAPIESAQIESARIDSTQSDAQSSSAVVPNRPPDSTDVPAVEDLTSDTSAAEGGESDSTQPSKPVRSDETVHERSAETAYSSDSVNASLESENSSLRKELQKLRGDLNTTQEVIRLWREAYEKACKQLSPAEKPPSKDERLPIADVRTAVALAREKYSGELVFQPNSKSEIEDSPFEKPTNVLAALEWLATTFYRSKMGEVSITDFNSSIKKACGWTYKGKQSKITMNRYKSWYTTSLEGKTYWLKRHVGTGSNKDSRYTIRIAFDWDSVRQVVVIGYIGQHQQTGAT